METLIVYYSKTGNTEKIAKLLAKELKAELFRIEEKKAGGLISAYFFGALGKKESEIKQLPDLSKYALICIGTPIWYWGPAPTINTFIKQGTFEGKKIVLFTTYMNVVGNGIEKIKTALKEKGAEIIAEEKFRFRFGSEERKVKIFGKIINEKIREKK